jgi:hypothetical protein
VLKRSVKNRGNQYKILFAGIRVDKLGLDIGKEVEGWGLIEIADLVKSSSSRSRDFAVFPQNTIL